jgi:hypothetical protein
VCRELTIEGSRVVVQTACCPVIATTVRFRWRNCNESGMLYFVWNNRHDISVTEVAGDGLDNPGLIFSIIWIPGAFCSGIKWIARGLGY